MPRIPSRPVLDLSGKWVVELPSLPEDYLAQTPDPHVLIRHEDFCWPRSRRASACTCAPSAAASSNWRGPIPSSVSPSWRQPTVACRCNSTTPRP